VRVANVVFVTRACIVAVAGAVTVAVPFRRIAAEAGAIAVTADTCSVAVAADAGAGTVTVTSFSVIVRICRFNICAPTHRAGGTVICPCVL